MIEIVISRTKLSATLQLNNFHVNGNFNLSSP